MYGQEYCFVIHAKVMVDDPRIPAASLQGISGCSCASSGEIIFAASPMMVSMRSIPATPEVLHRRDAF